MDRGEKPFQNFGFWLTVPRESPYFPQHWSSHCWEEGQVLYELKFESLCPSETKSASICSLYKLILHHEKIQYSNFCVKPPQGALQIKYTKMPCARSALHQMININALNRRDIYASTCKHLLISWFHPGCWNAGWKSSPTPAGCPPAQGTPLGWGHKRWVV